MNSTPDDWRLSLAGCLAFLNALVEAWGTAPADCNLTIRFEDGRERHLNLAETIRKAEELLEATWPPTPLN